MAAQVYTYKNEQNRENTTSNQVYLSWCSNDIEALPLVAKKRFSFDKT